MDNDLYYKSGIKNKPERPPFDEDTFINGFKKLVKDINTYNPDWKTYCIPEIKYELEHHLNENVYHRIIKDYDFLIERKGQSVIQCTLNYYNYGVFIPKTLVIKERVKTRKEINDLLLISLEKGIIKSKKQNVMGLLEGLKINLEK